MSSTTLEFETIVLPHIFPPGNPPQHDVLPSNESFALELSPNVVTLSTNTANMGTVIEGLLYVPDIDPSSACYNTSLPYIPSNVTRQKDLPSALDYAQIAIAPWLGPSCVLEYLSAANQQPAHAFITFLPGNGSGLPPDAASSVWDIGDGQAWKVENQYPVYAIPSNKGFDILQSSSQYSKNLTSVPYGQNLSQLYPLTDYVRLQAVIVLPGPQSLPSLWIFLLVVLAVLLAVIVSTSVAMHILQRRRREALRRRVANGEVDLEALGIKRLTVPQRLLDKMPLYAYGTESDSELGSVLHPQAKIESPISEQPAIYRPTALQQPTCAICLEDFVPVTSDSEGTTVRELPCRHIFHPECVDTFLRDNSSLCPMCKKTALPRGYCPGTITNVMVRRERVLRRAQLSDVTHTDSEGREAQPDTSTHRRHTLTNFAQFRRLSSAALSGLPMTQLPAHSSGPASSTNATANVVATAAPFALSDPPTAGSAEPGGGVRPSPNINRREWARQRALSMVGARDRAVPTDPETEEAARTSRWRKALQGIFPTIGPGA